jgi:hypothetical protein
MQRQSWVAASVQPHGPESWGVDANLGAMEVVFQCACRNISRDHNTEARDLFWSGFSGDEMQRARTVIGSFVEGTVEYRVLE